MSVLLADIALGLASFHGALTVGITSYPALESRFSVSPGGNRDVALSLVAVAPISKSEPLSLAVGAHITIWRF